MKELLFFRSNVSDYQSEQKQLPSYCWYLWTPSIRGFYPKGMKPFPYLVWAIFHFFRIFSNRDYGIFLIKNEDGGIVHRSVVTPRYFRFPFMKMDDLQIGDVWTADDQRGKGLAVFAINKIQGICAKPERMFWYLTEQENAASIRAAEKAGLVLFGKGSRRNRFGFQILGHYYIS